MSDLVIIAIVAAIPGTISAVLTYLGNRKVDSLSFHINGRMGELIAATKAEGQAAGKAEGVEQERTRHDA